MRRFRFTISRWMAVTAILGLNISLVRAYLPAERAGQHLDFFDGGFFMFFAVQFGLWRYLRTAGKRRRFWLGFGVCGVAATLAFVILSVIYMNACDWYTGIASDLSYLCLPRRVDILVSHEHWDWFLAIVYFLPELLAASLGGLLAARLFNVGEEGMGTTRTDITLQASPAAGRRSG